MRNELIPFNPWALLQPSQVTQPMPFFQMQYSRWELTGNGDQFTLRQHQGGYRDGKLWSEQTESMMPADALQETFANFTELQNTLLGQTAALFQGLLPFAAFPTKPRSD
ncbi:hypothetical protein RCH09_000474 [Actimicrobium sp. GrIS 1.19]|uniref:hypothetical protein n=1 Tax=Actimicrobium sp. GrIS 1.19 TaxID=3071708 RepID=UPI002DFA425D|nr:hypothetical protein [Actimicrobium sp. GrIS 1.19]